MNCKGCRRVIYTESSLSTQKRSKKQNTYSLYSRFANRYRRSAFLVRFLSERTVFVAQPFVLSPSLHTKKKRISPQGYDVVRRAVCITRILIIHVYTGVRHEGQLYWPQKYLDDVHSGWLCTVQHVYISHYGVYNAIILRLDKVVPGRKLIFTTSALNLF